jgi:hypothetical protein
MEIFLLIGSPELLAARQSVAATTSSLYPETTAVATRQRCHGLVETLSRVDGVGLAPPLKNEDLGQLLFGDQQASFSEPARIPPIQGGR